MCVRVAGISWTLQHKTVPGISAAFRYRVNARFIIMLALQTGMVNHAHEEY